MGSPSWSHLHCGIAELALSISFDLGAAPRFLSLREPIKPTVSTACCGQGCLHAPVLSSRAQHALAGGKRRLIVPPCPSGT